MAEICYIDWHCTPFRTDRFLDLWEPAAARVLAFGAKSWSLDRSTDDPLLVRQSSTWENRSDFERYWFSEEIASVRETTIDLYHKPILPSWHTLLVAE
ncbi:MAG TPA: hypothetical protein VKA88_03475 [Solirubrobacterales bacterium]|nr:hypothetical protein [Solirubrobacterales bacterium]